MSFKINRVLLLVLSATFLMLWSVQTASAIDCSSLKTNKQIVAFIKKTKESNPLIREVLSAHIEMRTNDKGTKKKEKVHSLRQGEKKRVVYLQGKNAPMCMVSKGEKKDFKCSECSLFSNSQCRSFKNTSKGTTIQGTNIDTEDLELPEKPEFSNVCKNMPGRDAYFIIESIKKSGDAKYDKILTYYEKKREIALTANYYAEGALRKVYRYFPKYYVQVDGEWMSMVTRVRTVAGSEKKYSFETMVIIEKSGKTFKLYLNPKKDPALKAMNFNLIYNTN